MSEALSHLADKITITGPGEEGHGFGEEIAGWTGYIEWDKYPEKREKAAALHEEFFPKLPPPPEYQLKAIPQTNPVMTSERRELELAYMGGDLAKIPDLSWEIVKKEKADDMIHLLKFPYNGETPRAKCVESAITPNEYHYVRNHSGIPDIDPSAYFFEVCGLVHEPKRISLKEIMDAGLFKQTTLTNTLQCSGTRRMEQINLYPGAGDELAQAPWSEGAIGTAVYEGVTLNKILRYCGGATAEGKHVEFTGADTYIKNGIFSNYAVSIPLRKIKHDPVMVAWSMNGVKLPKIHGYPLRVIVPGYIGARSVKWLTRITVLPEPSWGPVQRVEYLYFHAQMGKHNLKPSEGFSIQDMPVSSALMTPLEKAVIVHNGKISCSGWAYSGGGRWVETVEVSVDGGFGWHRVPRENLSETGYFTWRTWHCEVPVHVEGWIELVVRCWDNALNTQPTYVRSAWNWELHVTSSAHRVKVYSVIGNKPETAEALAKLAEKGLSLEPITKPLDPYAIESREEYKSKMAAQGPREPSEI